MDTDKRTIADIVTGNFKAAAVFEKYGLDYCCKGKVALDEACANHNIDLQTITSELLALGHGGGATNRFNDWSLSMLADYITNNHHAYVRSATERLLLLTRKVASRHGDTNPDLAEIAELFTQVAAEFEHHMDKEEHVLFPYIRNLEQTSAEGKSREGALFGTVANPIGQMVEEHESAGDLMARIRGLSSNYTPPLEACNTYRVTFGELQEFERDLHQHVHLENNILFPKAIARETALRGSENIPA